MVKLTPQRQVSRPLHPIPPYCEARIESEYSRTAPRICISSHWIVCATFWRLLYRPVIVLDDSRSSRVPQQEANRRRLRIFPWQRHASCVISWQMPNLYKTMAEASVPNARRMDLYHQLQFLLRSFLEHSSGWQSERKIMEAQQIRRSFASCCYSLWALGWYNERFWSGMIHHRSSSSQKRWLA